MHHGLSREDSDFSLPQSLKVRRVLPMTGVPSSGRDLEQVAHTILIVDDSPTTRRYVRGELESLGHHVLEASDGAAALELLEHARPALVISDVNMAPMDGLTLVARIRQRFSRKELPILMLTTEAGDDLKAQGRAVGASGWLTKPFDPARMHSVIQHVLSSIQGASAGRVT